jgi:hypothetical protein
MQHISRAPWSSTQVHPWTSFNFVFLPQIPPPSRNGGGHNGAPGQQGVHLGKHKQRLPCARAVVTLSNTLLQGYLMTDPEYQGKDHYEEVGFKGPHGLGHVTKSIPSSAKI